MPKSRPPVHGFLFAVAVGSICSLVGVALAQDGDPIFERLGAAHSLRCEFSTGTTANWDSGEPVLESSNFGPPVHFDAVDWRNNKARMIGNAGAADLHAILTPEGLTLIEQTPTGNFAFTTIFPIYKAGTRDFVAVHSRHMSIFGPVPSQYHGSCNVWE